MTPAQMNIYLIGMRAVGKSSVGRRLASKLGRPFIDMDEQLSAEIGRSISDFVRSNGWAAFRAREKALLERVARLNDHVVATGGGVVCTDVNTLLMRASGRVVWLKADVEVLRERLTQDRRTSETRPPIGCGGDTAAELETLMKERREAYARAMHVSVEVAGHSIETICRRIMDLIQ